MNVYVGDEILERLVLLECFATVHLEFLVSKRFKLSSRVS